MTVLDEIKREVENDATSVGLILHGSRAAGTARASSDFDLMRVVADETYLKLRVEALLESRGIRHQWGPQDDLQPLEEHRF